MFFSGGAGACEAVAFVLLPFFASLLPGSLLPASRFRSAAVLRLFCSSWGGMQLLEFLGFLMILEVFAVVGGICVGVLGIFDDFGIFLGVEFANGRTFQDFLYKVRLWVYYDRPLRQNCFSL